MFFPLVLSSRALPALGASLVEDEKRCIMAAAASVRFGLGWVMLRSLFREPRRVSTGDSATAAARSSRPLTRAGVPLASRGALERAGLIISLGFIAAVWLLLVRRRRGSGDGEAPGGSRRGARRACTTVGVVLSAARVAMWGLVLKKARADREFKFGGSIPPISAPKYLDCPISARRFRNPLPAKTRATFARLHLISHLARRQQ